MDHARAQAVNINNWPLQLGTSLQLMDARSIYLSTPPTTNGQQRAPNNTQHAKMYSRFLHAFTSLCTICLHVLHCFVRHKVVLPTTSTWASVFLIFSWQCRQVLFLFNNDFVLHGTQPVKANKRRLSDTKNKYKRK